MRVYIQLIVLLLMINLSAYAGEKSAEAPANAGNESSTVLFQDLPVNLQAALHQILPSFEGVRIKRAPLAGYYEIGLGSEVFYLSENAEMLLQGKVIDLPRRVDLTEQSVAEYRQQLLGALDKEQMINFVPEAPRYSVYVFTDVDCTYCRKLHAEIDQFKELGIAVHYLMYPRGGLNSSSFSQAESVWCSANREDALTRALLGEQTQAAQCDSPIRQLFEVGTLAGIAKLGTPTIVLENGQVVRGYVPPMELYSYLQRSYAVDKHPSSP